MRLKGNKRDISFNKVMDNSYRKEWNTLDSDNHIWDKQGISTLNLTTSNYLTYNIYDDIKG
jgi:hypothetical protein